MTTPVIAQITPVDNTHIKKRCSVCGELLPLTEEYFNKKSKKHGSKDGFRSDCKVCRSKKRRAAHKNDPSRARNSSKKYYKKYIQPATEKNTKKRKQKINLEKIKCDLAKNVKTPISLVDIFGRKKCTKCGEPKPNTEEFYTKRPDSLDGFSRICKECYSTVSKYKGRSKISSTSPMFKRLSAYEEIRIDPDNNKYGQCKCAYCGRWINPKYSHVKSRVNAFNHLNLGECRIYCDGDQCREACPTYQRQSYPKGFKKNTSREVSPLVRIMCMEKDNYTCQICGASGEGITLHAHHILSYARNKMLANDIQNVITLCKACHNEVHHQEGCEYRDLRCVV